jgi:methylated-DNA-[protein]-cysteine S-methyltransferase
MYCLSTPKHTENAVKTLATPVGTLVVEACDEGIAAVRWSDGTAPARIRGTDAAERVLDGACAWLAAYFAGRPLPPLPALAPEGTDFQRAVWRALTEIPAGEVRTYGALAAALGRPGAARAVGQANGKNPITILVPCHRVVAGGGRLGGYSAGLPRKRWLLAHEGVAGLAG